MSDIQTMLNKAQQIMHNAHAPYSKFTVGACLRTQKGHYYTGCNVENVSYSLTICAEASAIAHMVSQGEKEIAEIVITCGGDELCRPCGGCRQQLREFMSPSGLIHVANKQGNYKTYKLDELLPHSFGPENLV